MKKSGEVFAYLRDVQKAMKPFVHPVLLGRDFVNEEDLRMIRARLGCYSNVSMKAAKGPHDDGTLEILVSVHALLHGGTLRYELRSHGRRKKYYDPFAWIDELETLDMLIGD